MGPSGQKWLLDIFPLLPSVPSLWPCCETFPGQVLLDDCLAVSHFLFSRLQGVVGATGDEDLPLTSVFTGKDDWLTGNSSGSLWFSSLVLLLQPHLHSYREAFEEMEGTSPTSPPPSGGKNSTLSLPPLGALWPV